MRKGPDVPEFVTIRNPRTQQEKDVLKTSLPFFVNQGYVVLDAAGRVNSKATSAATSKKEEN
jgi:hypothetical protein